MESSSPTPHRTISSGKGTVVVAGGVGRPRRVQFQYLHHLAPGDGFPIQLRLRGVPVGQQQHPPATTQAMAAASTSQKAGFL